MVLGTEMNANVVIDGLVLDDALKTNPNISSLYELAYNYYEKQNDTVKCGEILKSAKKNLPKEAKGSIYSLELNYIII